MKISEGALDLDTTDYGVALDPSYTMLEFDSLKGLPVDTGLFDMTSNMLQCGLKCTRIALKQTGMENPGLSQERKIIQMKKRSIDHFDYNRIALFFLHLTPLTIVLLSNNYA